MGQIQQLQIKNLRRNLQTQSGTLFNKIWHLHTSLHLFTNKTDTDIQISVSVSLILDSFVISYSK